MTAWSFWECVHFICIIKFVGIQLFSVLLNQAFCFVFCQFGSDNPPFILVLIIWVSSFCLVNLAKFFVNFDYILKEHCGAFFILYFSILHLIYYYSSFLLFSCFWLFGVDISLPFLVFLFDFFLQCGKNTTQDLPLYQIFKCTISYFYL